LFYGDGHGLPALRTRMATPGTLPAADRLSGISGRPWPVQTPTATPTAHQPELPQQLLTKSDADADYWSEDPCSADSCFAVLVLQHGRPIDDIAFVESNPTSSMWGFATGGLWRIDEHGTTWQPIFDTYSTASIGDIPRVAIQSRYRLGGNW